MYLTKLKFILFLKKIKPITVQDYNYSENNTLYSIAKKISEVNPHQSKIEKFLMVLFRFWHKIKNVYPVATSNKSCGDIRVKASFYFLIYTAAGFAVCKPVFSFPRRVMQEKFRKLVSYAKLAASRKNLLKGSCLLAIFLFQTFFE